MNANMPDEILMSVVKNLVMAVTLARCIMHLNILIHVIFYRDSQIHQTPFSVVFHNEKCSFSLMTENTAESQCYFLSICNRMRWKS